MSTTHRSTVAVTVFVCAAALLTSCAVPMESRRNALEHGAEQGLEQAPQRSVSAPVPPAQKDAVSDPGGRSLIRGEPRASFLIGASPAVSLVRESDIDDAAVRTFTDTACATVTGVPLAACMLSRGGES